MVDGEPERDERTSTPLDGEQALRALLEIDPDAGPVDDVGLLGVWTLVTLQSIDPDGLVFHPLGPALAGQLVYDVSGRMSAQIVRTDQPRFASDEVPRALPDEAAAAWRASIGY